MEQVVILLMISASLIHVAETKCNKTQNITVCSVNPGGSEYIQVINDATGLRVSCTKKTLTGSVGVFKLRQGKLVIEEAFRKKTEFFVKNGTFKIINALRNDSGRFNVEVFNSNGYLVRNMDIELNVEEQNPSLLIPVSAGVGLLLFLIILIGCCCVCKSRKKSGSSSL